MMQIQCPWCGPRDEDEFCCGGQAHIPRPHEPSKISDADWAAYMHMRTNPMGVHLERWRHTFGCRQWFNMARDTVSHDILGMYQMHEAVPEALQDSAQLEEPKMGSSSKENGAQ